MFYKTLDLDSARLPKVECLLYKQEDTCEKQSVVMYICGADTGRCPDGQDYLVIFRPMRVRVLKHRVDST